MLVFLPSSNTNLQQRREPHENRGGGTLPLGVPPRGGGDDFQTSGNERDLALICRGSTCGRDGNAAIGQMLVAPRSSPTPR